MGHLGKDICRCRNYRKNTEPLGNANVLDLPIQARLEHVGQHLLTGQGFESQRRDKLGSGLRKNRLHGHARLPGGHALPR